MKLSKSIFFTIIYFISFEIIGFWIYLIPNGIENLKLLNALHFISAIITLTILISIFKLTKNTDLLKFNKTNSKFYILAILLGIGFVYFQSFLNFIYYQEFSTEFFNFDFTFERLYSLNIFASILIVPITEEIFFRNFIQCRLSKNYTPFKAIIIVSIIFAFIHIPFISLFYKILDFNLHQAYIALFGGTISGILFYKSKSIMPSIIFHVFWNLTSYIL